MQLIQLFESVCIYISVWMLRVFLHEHFENVSGTGRIVIYIPIAYDVNWPHLRSSQSKIIPLRNTHVHLTFCAKSDNSYFLVIWEHE